MKGIASMSVIAGLVAGGCATDAETELLHRQEEVNATTVIDAPSPMPGTYAPENRHIVKRGEYLVELLACGSCHTNGALIGEPDMDRPLAGSRTGIAYTNPLGVKNPGVIFPPNITPESETGIGDLSDRQIANAIRAGIGRHTRRRITTMPWQGYARMTDDDVEAIVSYLRSIKPVRHEVPKAVEPGHRATHPFVYFGVYRSKP